MHRAKQNDLISWTGKILFLALFGMPVLGMAQTTPAIPETEPAEDLSLDRFALELSNPATYLRRLAWDIEYTTFRGDLPGSENQDGLKNIFKTSWPLRLKTGKNLLLSATIPVFSDQPTWNIPVQRHHAEFRIRQTEDIQAEQGFFFYGHDHLADIRIDLAYIGEGKNGVIRTLGLAAVFPTSEDKSAARRQTLLGPEIALGRITNWGLYGATVKHLTNVNDPAEWDTNESTMEIWFAYALGNGWQIESSPEILYDWEAVSGNEWTVPIEAAVSKTIKLGQTPVKLALGIQKNIVTPDRFGPDWRVILSFTPVLSTKLLR